MNKLLTALGIVTLLGSVAFADDVWVNPYTKRDGTQVQGHYRSQPNAYKWDNKSYEPSQPAYNPSYYEPKKNYSPSYYQPSSTRFNDNNRHNDYAPTNSYQLPKLPSLYDND